MCGDIFDDQAAQELGGKNVFDGQAEEEFVEEPDERMWGDLIVGGLGYDDEGFAALRVTGGEFEEDHGGVTVTEQVYTFETEAVEDLAEFFGTFCEADGVRA